jgi:hypothetical protein
LACSLTGATRTSPSSWQGNRRKRRERSVSGGDYAWYNWDMGWNVINEEHSNGTLSMTFTIDNPAAPVAAILADASTTNPATGTYRGDK